MKNSNVLALLKHKKETVSLQTQSKFHNTYGIKLIFPIFYLICGSSCKHIVNDD